MSKYYNYLRKISENIKLLKPSNICKRKHGGNYEMSTRQLISPEFRNKWYPNGIKTIPKDLKLTPITCLYWYLDDGCLDKHNGTIILNTQGFLVKNLKEIILSQIEEILNCKNKVKIHMWKCGLNRKPIIRIPRRYTKKFLEYIGKCPVKEFEYKWNIKPYKAKGYKYV